MPNKTKLNWIPKLVAVGMMICCLTGNTLFANTLQEVPAEVIGFVGTVNGGLSPNGTYLLNPKSYLQGAVKVEWSVAGTALRQDQVLALCGGEPKNPSIYGAGVVHIHMPKLPLRVLQETGVVLQSGDVKALGEQKLTSEPPRLAFIDSPDSRIEGLPAHISTAELAQAAVENPQFQAGEATVLAIRHSSMAFCGLAQGKYALSVDQKIRLLPFQPITPSWLNAAEAAVIGMRLDQAANSDHRLRTSLPLQIMTAAKAYALLTKKSLMDIGHKELLPFAKVASAIMSGKGDIDSQQVSKKVLESTLLDGEFLADGELNLKLNVIDGASK